ncbi:hypothetical protein OQA88_7960 [Cercophora sp. LCS_1]
MALLRLCLGLTAATSLLIGQVAATPLAGGTHLSPKGNLAARDEDLFVTPAPGLPSLESLGITAADLFDDEWLNDNAPSVFNATGGSSIHRRAADCGIGGGLLFYKPAARACAAYLDQLGTTMCVAPAYPASVTMCSAGSGTSTATVGGTGRGGTHASWCTHVSYAAQAVIASCGVNADWANWGFEYAWGNGNLEIYVIY